MPGREEPREESVFVNQREVAVHSSHPYSESRDMTPDGMHAREPFVESEGLVNEDVPEQELKEPKPSIDDIVRNIVIHDDRPIENLPTMTAPELKLIGRCVSLCVAKKVDDVELLYYYTGLVSSVTFAAVTLMHVSRYTRADFKEYITREKQVSKEGQQQQQQQQQQQGQPYAPQKYGASKVDVSKRHDGLSPHGYNVEGAVGVGQDGGLVGTQDPAALLRLDAAGSLAPAVQMLTEEEVEMRLAVASTNTTESPDGVSATAAAAGDGDGDAFSPPAASEATRVVRHKAFRSWDDSIGPLPYVTFLRKNIHDVRFGRDPRSSFYSLFQDPEKQMLDMQYLRMFVRRYLVHTSEGNNPRQVPLYAFVTVRCACPYMDRDLVYRLAREELPGLMRADKSIQKEKKRQRSRIARQQEAIQSFQAPAGIFSHTGILYVTRLPQMTFMIAVATLIFVVVFILYLGISIGVMKDALIVAYERKLLGFFIPSIVVWAVAGVCMLLHSLYVQVPLRTGLVPMILRSIWSVGGLACAIMVVVVIAERLRNRDLYHYMNSANPDDLCAFYSRYGCSGFLAPCAGNPDAMCSSFCAQGVAVWYEMPCYGYVWNQVQLQVIPLLVFAAVLFCLLIYGLFLLWKLWSTAHKITARIRSSN